MSVATTSINIFEFNSVYRDGIQSNQGTNPSAAEMIEAFGPIIEDAYASYQIGGGTFMDLFMKKGRDEWGENSTIFGAFEDVVSTALLRGDCALGYDRNPQDVLDALIEELAERGLNVVTNFHGGNYAPMQEGIFKAVQKARAQGYDIVAPKVLCIEDNPNITVENCMAALEQQAAMGADEGIYLKNASGKADPDFVYELTKNIAQKYPDQKITIHTHDNHGLGDAIYMAAAEAGAEMNATIAFDVLPDPLASGTAQSARGRIQELLENHPSEAVRSRVPAYDRQTAEQHFDSMYTLRRLYSGSEVRYSKKLFDAAYKAGMAGGAMSAIKGMGFLEVIRSQYGLESEDDAFVLLAETEVKIKEKLGYPTNVTPYQLMMDLASVQEIMNGTNDLHPMTVNYLIGGLGPVSKLASSEYQDLALKIRGLKETIPFIPADQLPPKMPETQMLLAQNGCADRPRHDVVTAAMFGQEGFNQVVKKAEGTLEPQQRPATPDYLNSKLGGRSARRYHAATALGGAAALEKFALAVTEMEKHADGFYKIGIVDSWYNQEISRQSEGLKNEFSEQARRHRASDGYLKEFHTQKANEARRAVAEFIAAIPENLQEYGMDKQQASFTTSMILYPLLSEIVDKKARGASKRSFTAETYNEIMGVSWEQAYDEPEFNDALVLQA